MSMFSFLFLGLHLNKHMDFSQLGETVLMFCVVGGFAPSESLPIRTPARPPNLQ